jgi:crotonobetainyl-CoA:carnitine CoA-transferase CaiB-like acyl-CoA transferase
VFRTSDLRFLAIVLLQSDRDWPEFSERLDAPQLREDPRFADSAGRLANAKALVAELDSVFGKRSLAEWKERLHGADFVWDVFQNPAEVAEDPQVLANDYVVRVADAEGSTAPDRLVASPVQFDERSMVPRRAPEHAEHSELILLDLGLEWDEIAQLKDQDVVS